MTNSYTIFETVDGFCAIAWNDAGITAFQLPSKKLAETRRRILHKAPGAELDEPNAKVADTIAAAQRYFQGEQVDFSAVPIDFTHQSAFFTRIYEALRQVHYGRTTTYGALAKQIGAGPEAARDVGQAMATNPVPLIVPCHRVLAAGGKTGGFSAPGGTKSKLRMLELEGVHVGPLPPNPSPAPQKSFDF
ncbi:MAG TPA: methylated-DNA--[protein]-cysteine S-methyltransferase [Stellaceae bacterium]|nr:methylated-DNA--[protein]-cysteine S-methyltransferase [Stellaceae bacterium]